MNADIDDDLIEEATDAGEQLPLDLPDYHGRKPVGMKTSVNGAGNRLTVPHGIGDTVVLLVEAKVKRAGHEEADDGLLYAETLKVVDLFEIGGEAGRDLLRTQRLAYQDARRSADGEDPLPLDLGVEVTIDGSGVALTPAELAEQTGGVDGVDQLAVPAPWLGYEDRSVAEIKESIAALDSVGEVQAVLSYELAHRARSTVLKAAGERRGLLEAADR